MLDQTFKLTGLVKRKQCEIFFVNGQIQLDVNRSNLK